ncbi:MAG: type VI secretion system-associated FHA domain protein TagH [Thiobacillus sp.]|nr:type VI secretion system-associated FHA domain protein TagH [Thiobacillus sp.]
MQLILRATGTPAGVPLVSRAFGSGGGTIGRNPGCTLELPDPHRYISRVHAEIRQQDGRFFLKVISKVNPVVVNGSPVGFNQMVELKVGDVLSLGDYGFVAELGEGEPARFAAGPAVADPFAMFDGLTPSRSPAEDTLKQDPFFREQSPEEGPSTVWGGFEQPASSGSLTDLVQAPPTSSDDPLMNILQGSETGKKGGAAPPARSVTPAPAQDASAVDRFLGLGDVEASLLGQVTSPSDATLPGAGGLGDHGDHVLDINLPFNAPARKAVSPPPAKPAQPAAPKPAAGEIDESIFADLLGSLPGQPAPPPSAAPAKPSEDLFSLLDGLIEPPPVAPAQPAAPQSATPQSAAPQPATPQPAAPQPQAVVAPAPHAEPSPVPAAPVAGQAAVNLIAKLAEGLNMPGLQVPPAEAEAFMLELGKMFRTAVEGVHTLLLLRAEVKKELRAEDRTMIASRENNPLKHTETVEEALNYLLAYGAANAAFLPPARAMEDAFRDMRAHELAVMAGMRAGLAGVLKRFDPKALEPRIKKAGALDSMVPALYKAKLWDTYTEFYKDIESEAEDHFDKLFGREFVRAYMEQTKQLKKSKKT